MSQILTQEKKAEYNQRYYEKNKEKIQARYREKSQALSDKRKQERQEKIDQGLIVPKKRGRKPNVNKVLPNRVVATLKIKERNSDDVLLRFIELIGEDKLKELLSND